MGKPRASGGVSANAGPVTGDFPSEAEIPSSSELVGTIVGRWVTSFLELFPADPPPARSDDEQATYFVVDQIAPLIPSYGALLLCFIFRQDGTVRVHKQLNHSDFGFDEESRTGFFTINALDGVPAGEIVIERGASNITFKYLMIDANELRFICAYGASSTERAPVAAGSMHRVMAPA